MIGDGQNTTTSQGSKQSYLQSLITLNNQYQFLSKITPQWEFETGNPNTKVELIDVPNLEKKFIKKTTILNNQNAEKAVQEMKYMRLINSEHVVKILYAEVKKQIDQETNQNIKKLCLYMEYCEEGDLENYLAEHELSMQQRVEILLQILMGLKDIHQRHIVHRDLKLQNIFVTKEGKVKIGDLGVSSQTTSLCTTNVGTIGSQAPQIHCFAENGYCVKSDVWSLGYIAYQLLSIPNTYQQQTQGHIDPFLPQEKLIEKLQNKPPNKDGKQYFKEILNDYALIISNDIYQPLIDLLMDTLVLNPSQRISMKDIYGKCYLERLKNYMKIPEETLITFRSYKVKYEDIEKQREHIEGLIQKYETLERIYLGLKQKSAEIYTLAKQIRLKTMKLQFLCRYRLMKIYEQMHQRKMVYFTHVKSKSHKQICHKLLELKNRINFQLFNDKKAAIDKQKGFYEQNYFEDLVSELKARRVLEI